MAIFNYSNGIGQFQIDHSESITINLTRNALPYKTKNILYSILLELEIDVS